MEKEKVRCEVCGKEFANSQGLAGHMQFKHSEPDTLESKPPAESRALVKSMPVEVLIQGLQLPEVSDGTRVVFDAGVEYGMKSILIGVRIAQELSRMGVDQATPIIKMAQEMRQSEARSAQEAAALAAEETAARMAAYFDQRKPDIASTPNPIMGVFARTMETLLNRVTGMMFGGGQAGQAQMPPGWADKRQGGQ